jgi:hypothetical protein|tara:strand:- start:437 stop:1081 length:645 start_codon:yes stop_codon:yes gene_type:complete
MSAANPTQYYPTPPEAVIPLREWLRPRISRGVELLDPCAGRGALPLFMGKGHRWQAIETLPDFADDLRAVPQVVEVKTCDALRVAWPPYHVIANPPYGRELGEFASKLAAHARRHEKIGAMLSRVTWWGEGQRSELAPDVLLWIRGRISFTGDGKADTSSHCWALWLPFVERATRVIWCDKGTPTDDERDQWRQMLGLEGSQLGLFGGADDGVA